MLRRLFAERREVRRCITTVNLDKKEMWEINRFIVGEVFFIKIVFLEKRNDSTRFELIRKGTEATERFMMIVKVGRSADRHCLRRDVGMGLRSEKELNDWEIILDTSFSETTEKELSIEGVFFGGIWGDEIVEENFKAVCSLRINWCLERICIQFGDVMEARVERFEEIT